mmetsp:Transcript_21674/g.31542  ORF Transcript_21674/g.31542 Transcript_21674/m.31542 type:complete len:108 (+) Transcript_21674:29-352(+)
MLKFRALSAGFRLFQLRAAPSVNINAGANGAACIATGNNAIGPVIRSEISGALASLINDGILFLKRTFQPSLIRRKRKHGFLARNSDRNGRKVLNRRRIKKRRYVSV